MEWANICCDSFFITYLGVKLFGVGFCFIFNIYFEIFSTSSNLIIFFVSRLSLSYSILSFSFSDHKLLCMPCYLLSIVLLWGFKVR